MSDKKPGGKLPTFPEICLGFGCAFVAAYLIVPSDADFDILAARSIDAAVWTLFAPLVVPNALSYSGAYLYESRANKEGFADMPGAQQTALSFGVGACVGVFLGAAFWVPVIFVGRARRSRKAKP